MEDLTGGIGFRFPLSASELPWISRNVAWNGVWASGPVRDLWPQPHPGGPLRSAVRGYGRPARAGSSRSELVRGAVAVANNLVSPEFVAQADGCVIALGSNRGSQLKGGRG